MCKKESTVLITKLVILGADKIFDLIVGHLSFNRHCIKTSFNAVTISLCMNFHDLSR